MGRVIPFIVLKLKIERPNVRSKTELIMLLGKSVVRKIKALWEPKDRR